MNTIKTIFLSFLTFTIASSVHAQTFKEPVAFKLKNEMNIIVSENNSSPKAYASFTLVKGAFADKKDGIIELLNVVLNENIVKNNNLLFNDNSGKLVTETNNFDQELVKMAALIQNAVIDQKTFNSAKAKLMVSLKNNDYDYDQTVNQESISALTLTDIQDFYNQISPEKTYLTIAGNIETSAAKASAKKAFGTWNVNAKQEIASVAK